MSQSTIPSFNNLTKIVGTFCPVNFKHSDQPGAPESKALYFGVCDYDGNVYYSTGSRTKKDGFQKGRELSGCKERTQDFSYFLNTAAGDGFRLRDNSPKAPGFALFVIANGVRTERRFHRVKAFWEHPSIPIDVKVKVVDVPREHHSDDYMSYPSYDLKAIVFDLEEAMEGRSTYYTSLFTLLVRMSFSYPKGDVDPFEWLTTNTSYLLSGDDRRYFVQTGDDAYVRSRKAALQAFFDGVLEDVVGKYDWSQTSTDIHFDGGFCKMVNRNHEKLIKWSE